MLCLSSSQCVIRLTLVVPTGHREESDERPDMLNDITAYMYTHLIIRHALIMFLKGFNVSVFTFEMYPVLYQNMIISHKYFLYYFFLAHLCMTFGSSKQQAKIKLYPNH